MKTYAMLAKDLFLTVLVKIFNFIASILPLLKLRTNMWIFCAMTIFRFWE